MAFWRIGNGFSSISAVDKILDRKDHSLGDLLNEPDLLQELVAPNTRLNEYLRQPEIMAEMISIIADLNPLPVEDAPSEAAPAADQQAKGDHDIDTTDPMSISPSPPSGPSTAVGSSPPSPPSLPLDLSPASVPTGDSGDTSDSDDNDEDDEPGEAQAAQQPLSAGLALLSRAGYGGRDAGDDDDSSDSESDQGKGYDDTDQDAKEILRRQAQMSAEILSADVWSLTEALMENNELIDELWKILDYPSPLDITYASYFTKINEHLLDKKTDDMLNFIRSQPLFVKRLMNHVDNPPLMDFLLKVISSDKSDNSTGIIDFLQSQKLIPSLIAFLAPDVPPSVQSAAGDFLKAFVTISAHSNTDNNTIGPNELSRELVSEPCVRELLRLMLHGGTGLGTGVGVIIEIIRKNNSDYDPVPVLYITLESHPPGPRDSIYLGTLVSLFAEAIPQFQAILTRDHTEEFATPFGKIEPLGFERFKICELIAELLHCSNMTLLNDPAAEGIVRARDEQRQRVKEIIARARGEMDTGAGEEGEDADSSYNSIVASEPESRADPSIEANKSIEAEIDDLSINKHESPALAPSEDITIESTDAVPREPLSEESAESATATTNELKSDDDDDNGAYHSAASEQEGPNWQDANDGTAEETNDSAERERLEQEQQASLDEQRAALMVDPVVGDKMKIALADNGCINTILGMFRKFPWNNFLHNVVFDIVQQVLNGPMQQGFNKFLAIDMFEKGRLTEMICECHDLCEQHEEATNIRLGYMGHLTLISEEVVKFTAVYPPETVSPVVAHSVAKPDWIHYVTHTLVRTREQHNTILGGKRPAGNEYERNSNAIIMGNGEDMDTNDEDEDIGSELGETDEDMPLGHLGHRRLNSEDVDQDARQLALGKFDDDDEADEGDDDGDVGHNVDSKGRKRPSRLKLEGSGEGDQFSRYMSQQISGTGHFGSSDEDEDDEEWDSNASSDLHESRYTAGHRDRKQTSEVDRPLGLLGDGDDDDDEDDDLGLVRSRSYNYGA